MKASGSRVSLQTFQLFSFVPLTLHDILCDKAAIQPGSLMLSVRQKSLEKKKRLTNKRRQSYLETFALLKKTPDCVKQEQKKSLITRKLFFIIL